MTTHCTICLHMVASLDGYIARKDNSISWFDTTDRYEAGVEPEDAAEFLAGIDAYIMGANTYEHALALAATYGWAYGDKPCIVVASRPLRVDRPSVEIFTGDHSALVEKRLAPHYKNCWVVGGAALAHDFLQQQLVQEIRLSILPILLGGGLPFFTSTGLEQPLHLKNVSAYKNGMVELHYEIKPA
ncbi:MAG TPA: dihydrofolate reductase family protein [Chitinophagaceae bacterium]|nr:dihydrofolate reductase family protein [Chitinophagaceae bacterium]